MLSARISAINALRRGRDLNFANVGKADFNGAKDDKEGHFMG
ncbi:hypothetical protein WDV76_01370 [Xenorhabdus griffiniae]